MKKSAVLFLTLLITMAAALVACDKQPAEQSEAEEPAAEQEAPAEQEPAAEEAPADDQAAAEQKAGEALPEEVAEPTKQALESYDKAHDLLVDDKTEGLAEAASGIQKSAKAAAEKAGEEMKPNFTALAEAAAKLEESAGDIEAARKAYGDVSRSVITVLTDAPGIAKDWHVFQCGMAKPYGKWAQPESELANPYMGQRMPACGGTAEMTP